MLYLLIVRVFGNVAKRWYLLLPLCWVSIEMNKAHEEVEIAFGLLHQMFV